MKHALLSTTTCFLVLLCGCGGSSLQRHRNPVAWDEQEARLYDIPILLNAQPIFKKQKDTVSSSHFSYRVSCSRDDALKFYEQEMERLGWQLFSRFDTDEEPLLMFEKPAKVCAVLLRPFDHGLEVAIYYQVQ